MTINKEIKYVVSAENKTQQGFNDAQQSLDKLNKSTQTTNTQQKGLGAQLSNNIKNFNVMGVRVGVLAGGIGRLAGAVGALAVAYTALSLKMATVVDGWATMAAKMNLSIADYQRLQYVASQTDVSMETITGTVSKLTGKIVDAAKGNKEAIKTFNNLGISVRDSNGNLKTGTQVLQELLPKLAGVEDKGLRAALAQDILGKNFAEYLPMLDEGVEGLEKLNKASEKYIFVNEEQAKSAKRIGDAFAAIKLSTQGFLIQLSSPAWSAFASTLETMADVLLQLRPIIKDTFDFWGEQFSKVFNVDDLNEYLGYLKEFFSNIRAGFYNLLNALQYGFEGFKKNMLDINTALNDAVWGNMFNALVAIDKKSDPELKKYKERLVQFKKDLAYELETIELGKSVGMNPKDLEKSVKEVERLKTLITTFESIIKTGKVTSFSQIGTSKEWYDKINQRKKEILDNYFDPNVNLITSKSKKTDKTPKKPGFDNIKDNKDLNSIIQQQLSFEEQLTNLRISNIADASKRELAIIRNNYYKQRVEAEQLLAKKIIKQEQYNEYIIQSEKKRDSDIKAIDDAKNNVIKQNKLEFNKQITDLYIANIKNASQRELAILKDKYVEDKEAMWNSLQGKQNAAKLYSEYVTQLTIKYIDDVDKANGNLKEREEKALKDRKQMFIDYSLSTLNSVVQANTAMLESMKGIEGIDVYGLLQVNAWNSALVDLSSNFSETMIKLEDTSLSSAERMNIKFQAIGEAITSVFNTISQVMSMNSQRIIEGYEKQREAVDKTYNAERERLENSRMNNVRRKRALDALDKAREKAQEDITKKTEEQQKKAAKAQLSIQLVQAVGATALGVTQALGTPAPFNLILAGLVGAMGAIQIGLIGSQLSKFANGGIVGGNSYSGDNQLARVNSGEMVLNKQQQSNLFNMANGKGGSSQPLNVDLSINIEGSATSETVTMIDNSRAKSLKELEGMLSDLKYNGRLNYILR